MLSQTVEYALRATLYIARGDSDVARVSDIASAVDAPQDYLAKILAQLARSGVLESSRGPTGGFRLAESSDRLPLSSIVAVFTGNEGRRCLLGHGRCGESPSCTAHERWAPIANEMDSFFTTTTIADLLAPHTTLPADSLRGRPASPASPPL